MGGAGVGLVMVGAAVYGVLQLALLAWPVRASRVSTILLAFVVGAYGSGVVVLLVTVAWWRVGVEAGGVPEEVAASVTENVAPVVEELAKVAPLLVAGWVGMRRQWGLADFMVLGAAVGAGFGLLETLMNHPPDPAALTALDGQGWMGQAGLSLTATYYPSPSEVLISWLPSSTGVLELGLGYEGQLGTQRHVLWGALDGLAVGVLLRAQGWHKAWSLALVAATIGHHFGINNGGGEDFPGWARTLVTAGDDWMVETTTGLLLLAVLLDWRQLRWGKGTVPGVLLATERAHRTADLIGVANRHLPYTALAVTRFVRARRHLLYAAAITRTEHLHRIEPLRLAVVEAATLLDRAHHHGRFETDRIRAAIKKTRAAHRTRARLRLFVLALGVVVSLPSLLYLGIGNCPSTADLGQWFVDSPGTTVLFVSAAASLGLSLVALVLLVRAWRPTRRLPLAEPATALALRLTAAIGGLVAGGWLMWIRATGTPVDEEIIDTDRASLFAALDQLLFALGLALLVLGVVAFLLPPAGFAVVTAGGVAAAAGGGAVISTNVAGAAVAVGILGAGTATVLNEATNEGSSGPSSQGPPSKPGAEGGGQLGPGRPPGAGENWPARVADNGKGTVWQAPNATGNANSVRIMNPTPRYPNGYVRFYNEHGQPIGVNGKPGSRADTHIPIDNNGNYPIPHGW